MYVYSIYSIYIYVYIFILLANRVISLKKAFLPPALQYSYSIFDLPEKRPDRSDVRELPPGVNSTLPALGAPAVFQSCHIAGPQHNSNSSTSTSKADWKTSGWINGDRINRLFHLMDCNLHITLVYWGHNPLILAFDPKPHFRPDHLVKGLLGHPSW